MDKISISAVEKVMKECYEGLAEIDWHGNKLIVKRTLQLHEMLEFVCSVVKSCFAQSSGDYIPEVKDFALLNNIVEYYSNVRLPESLERKYEMLYKTDLIPKILEQVNDRQFNEMVMAINTKVKNAADQSVEKLLKQLNSVTEQFRDVAEKMGSMFSGVSNDDIQNILSAVADGPIDEEKIVQLVLEQSKPQADQQADNKGQE